MVCKRWRGVRYLVAEIPSFGTDYKTRTNDVVISATIDLEGGGGYPQKRRTQTQYMFLRFGNGGVKALVSKRKDVVPRT